MKTINQRGAGYDRCGAYDEICVDFSIYPEPPTEDSEKQFIKQVKMHKTTMRDQTIVSPVVEKVLNSMKRGEQCSALVKNEYVKKVDP